MAAEAEYPGSQNQGQELECQISDGRLWLNGMRTAALSLRDLGGVNIASYTAALSCLLSPGAGTLKLCVINVCGWAALCGRGCPTGCRMFCSIPVLSIIASCTHCPQLSQPDTAASIARYPMRGGVWAARTPVEICRQ